MKHAPIGVFDSGVGGLTAVKELHRLLPGEDIVYFGDTARVPYGSRSGETILRYAKEDVAFLLSKDVKLILVACGTVSSLLPPAYAASLPVPCFGVVESTAAAAAAATKNGRIGVIGTAATIKSGSYVEAISKLRPDIQLYKQSCPLFVPLVENGRVSKDDPVTAAVAREYLAPLQKAQVDTLILGCTHYPIIAPVIASVMGPKVTLVDSGREGAKAAAKALQQRGLLSGGAGGAVRYYVSDSTEGFDELAHIFLDDYRRGTAVQAPWDRL
ncbi:MAG: glutamate racemase [Oscillospiraceae bacterium]|nr:glutamate racemase [Oscillospiraceae bacterium]